ncbi:MAG: NUDIX hydrolase, partial [Lachnospiraceae bacterium]|nr:NUDIX hydrolase [Lachnospiraceae bacterium]
MRFVEDISRFYGTGERNKAGQTLEEYLDGYDPRQFDLPSNTTDIIVVRCEEELKSWEQQMEVLLIKRGNHPGIGFWATPGGFVEMRENMDEGAARELEEETGIQGLPLVQMATWGDYDRDPRWRVITTSYLALVEGDLAVQAGDDAADALWFKVSLKQESNDTENRIEVWNLNLVNEERMIQVGAKVELIHSGHKLLDKKQYHIVENNCL